MSISSRLKTSTVEVEPFEGFDGQGSPSYGSASEIEARAVRSSEQTINSEGSDVRIDLVLWADADESPLPDTEDRVTHDGTTYIVETRTDGRKLTGELDHVKLEAREE